MGKITVVGIGPGSLLDMTPRARQAIESAEVIAGYNTYIKLIEELLGDRKVIGTAMMQEIDRCKMAVAEAAAASANPPSPGCGQRTATGRTTPIRPLELSAG